MCGFARRRQFLEALERQAVRRQSLDISARERPRRAVGRGRIGARAGDDEHPGARLQEGGQRPACLRQQAVRQRLQRVAFVYEIEGAQPFRWWVEEVGGAKIDTRAWEALLRPADRVLGEIEGGHIRARGGQGFGIVAEAAADIERAEAGEGFPLQPVSQQGMRMLVRPGHGGFVAIEMVPLALKGAAAHVLVAAILFVSLCVIVVGVRYGWSHTMGFGGNFDSSSLKLPLDWIGMDVVRVKLRYMYGSLLACMLLLVPVNLELLIRHLIGILQPGRALPQPEPLHFVVTGSE